VAREHFLVTLRALAECFNAFERYSAAQVRQFGLTPPQFDIIATLGNTPGMSFRELGEKTLITKGTLTGIVDRLEARGLVKRRASASDKRSVHVSLTKKGEREFERVFATHIDYLKAPFSVLNQAELDELTALAARLKTSFDERGMMTSKD
jgi:MarR family transcriptional regulator, 2-MHQ and catechol-resistance regulon repressor